MFGRLGARWPQAEADDNACSAQVAEVLEHVMEIEIQHKEPTLQYTGRAQQAFTEAEKKA